MTRYFKFPTGEVHCKMDESSDILFVPPQENLNDYLMTVMLACEAYDRFREGKPFDLLLPYLPYSRQDRPTSVEEPFSLRVVGNMINSVPHNRVITVDVHSDVAYACVDRLINIGPEHIWLSELNPQSDVLVIPDQGAYKKLSKLSAHFNDPVICIKQRDTSTGRLKLREVIGNVRDRDCVIVDDICDAGGTFKMIAERLLEMGVRSLTLMVTHGIFSKGVEVLQEAGFTRVFATDSFPQHSPFVKVKSISQIVEAYFEHTSTDGRIQDGAHGAVPSGHR